MAFALELVEDKSRERKIMNHANEKMNDICTLCLEGMSFDVVCLFFCDN